MLPFPKAPPFDMLFLSFLPFLAAATVISPFQCMQCAHTGHHTEPAQETLT